MPAKKAPTSRTTHFGFRLSKAEREVVERVAFNMDLTPSQFARLAVREMAEKNGAAWPRRRNAE